MPCQVVDDDLATGDRIERPAPLEAALAALYPTDQPVGFEEGDFRGFFWAEVPKGGGK